MLKHGEFVAPAIADLEGKEPAANKARKESLSGVLQRFGKRNRASDEPSALGTILFR